MLSASPRYSRRQTAKDWAVGGTALRSVSPEYSSPEYSPEYPDGRKGWAMAQAEWRRMVGSGSCRAAGLAFVLCASSCLVVMKDGHHEVVQRHTDYATFEGREFVFLPKHEALRKYGYMDWYKRPERLGGVVSANRVGQRGRLAKDRLPTARGCFYPACLEDGTVIYWNMLRSRKGRPRNVFFPDEVQAAEAMVGQTVWLDKRYWPRLPDGLHLTPAEVLAVRPPPTLTEYECRASDNRPWLRCRKTDGSTLDLPLRTPTLFLTSDPFAGMEWSTSTVVDIRAQKIRVGMTPAQVILSWGKPTSINASGGIAGASEQWVYASGSYLYFQKGRLTSWQVSRVP